MSQARPPALEVSGLSFRAGGAAILDGIGLAVADGDFLGIIGPNGAGKTTLFNLISGLLTPSAGTVRLSGRDLAGRAPADRARLGLGRTFQTSLLFGALPVAENARLAAQAHLGGRRRPRRADEASARAHQALEAVGLAGVAGRPAAALSHGDRRKLELAILIASRARVLLL